MNCPSCNLPMAEGEVILPEGQRNRAYTCINRRCPLFNERVEGEIIQDDNNDR